MLKRSGYFFFNPSIFFAAIPFLLWDIWAVTNNHWLFNTQYILGIKIFNLPAEELLFFILIPQASLLIWVALNKYTSWKEFQQAFLKHFQKGKK